MGVKKQHFLQTKVQSHPAEVIVEMGEMVYLNQVLKCFCG